MPSINDQDLALVTSLLVVAILDLETRIEVYDANRISKPEEATTLRAYHETLDRLRDEYYIAMEKNPSLTPFSELVRILDL